MGEPVMDRTAARLDRTIPRAATNDMVRGMYGSLDFIQDLVQRVRRTARGVAEINGEVIYDVEPVMFDDLIEVRTGGDRSVMTSVNVRDVDECRWVSYWPLMGHDPDQALAGWETALRQWGSTPHVVIAEVDSLLEQALTFDFGYQAYRSDRRTSWRRMTSPQFVEQLKEEYRRQQQDATGIRREARLQEMPQAQYTYLDRNNDTVTVRPEASGSSLYTATTGNNLYTTSSGNTIIEERRLSREAAAAAMRTSYRAIINSVDDPTPEDEPMEETPTWVPHHSVQAWNTLARVDVNREGLDRDGNDPTTAGYSMGPGVCNCDGCMEVRFDTWLQEQEDDDDVYIDDEGDYDMEEDDEG